MFYPHATRRLPIDAPRFLRGRRVLREVRRVRHLRSNGSFRPRRTSQMGYRAFRGTRMATGIQRSRRPNSPFSRPGRVGRLRFAGRELAHPARTAALTPHTPKATEIAHTAHP
jgi:hypothetical protein